MGLQGCTTLPLVLFHVTLLSPSAQAVAGSPAGRKNGLCIGEHSAHSTASAPSSSVAGLDARGAPKRRRDEEAEDSDADRSDGELQVRMLLTIG